MSLIARTPDEAERLTLQEMIAVFNLCVGIRAIARRMNDQADEMNMLALNAAIAAANGGSHRPVLHALAKETAEVATAMAGRVADIHRRAEGLAHRALEGVERARMARMLLAGGQGVCREANGAVVASAIARNDEALKAVLRATRQTARRLESQRSQLGRLNALAGAVAFNYRIEISRGRALQAHMAGFCTGLSQLCEAVSLAEASLGHFMRDVGRVARAA